MDQQTAAPAPQAPTGPYTADLIARFNHWTHFPTTVEKENRDHAAHMAEVRGATQAQLQRHGVQGMPERVEQALARYEKAVIDSYHRRVRAREMAPPVTVVGGSNYHKHARPEKAHKHEALGWAKVELARSAIRRAVQGFAPSATIKSSDEDAVEALESRIAVLEAAQVDRVALNKAWRKGGEAGLVAAGLTPEKAAQVARRIADDYSWCKAPHPAYELSNANANIRRLKARLEQVKRAHQTPTTSREAAGGVRVEDDPQANRVRLHFPGKPDPETRTQLKRAGFRWAPSVGAWQAYRNWRSQDFIATHYPST